MLTAELGWSGEFRFSAIASPRQAPNLKIEPLLLILPALSEVQLDGSMPSVARNDVPHIQRST